MDDQMPSGIMCPQPKEVGEEKGISFSRPEKILKMMAVVIIAVGSIALRVSRTSDAVLNSDISHIHGIAVDRTASSQLYLATQNGVYLTSRKATAQRVSDNRNDYMGLPPHAMTVIAADPNVISGLYRDIQVSRDGGTTWEVTGSAPASALDVAASGAPPHPRAGRNNVPDQSG